MATLTLTSKAQEGTYDIKMSAVDSIVNGEWTNNDWVRTDGMVAAYGNKVTLIGTSGRFVFTSMKVTTEAKKEILITRLETYNNEGFYTPSKFVEFPDELRYAVNIGGIMFTYLIVRRE